MLRVTDSFSICIESKQKELAEKLGKSSSCVNSVLNGRGADFTTEDFRMIRLYLILRFRNILKNAL